VRPLSQIRMTDLFDGRLEKAGVREEHGEDTTANLKFLTDGRNFLWVYGNEKGLVSRFTRRGMMNAPQRILQAICDEFDVDIVSEYEPEFWGYETKEEWEAAWAAIAEKDEQSFYNEVVKFVRGEGHEIGPGSIGMIKAEIAKRLIAESPDLLAEDKRPDLIKAVNLVLFAFLVLGHGRRQLLWFAVTRHPTAEWLARQIVEAFPWGTAPTYLVRDNDRSYGQAFTRRLRTMGIRDRPISPRSPWQNAYVERLIGTLRRECLDHVLIYGERHLRRILTLYSLYYNETRTHLGLGKDTPLRRSVQRSGAIVTIPILSGLHHRYARI
jgi:Integrase core domain